MARSRPERPSSEESEHALRDRVRAIGLMDPYVGVDPHEVEERIRNMSYGATNSRVSKLRRDESEETQNP